MLDRVKAKLSGLRRDFCCLALRRILLAQKANAVEKAKLEEELAKAEKAKADFDEGKRGLPFAIVARPKRKKVVVDAGPHQLHRHP